MIYLVFKRVPLRQFVDSFQAWILYSIASIFSVRIQDRVTVYLQFLDGRARECPDVGNIYERIYCTIQYLVTHLDTLYII